jgi:hypothetical protein
MCNHHPFEDGDMVLYKKQLSKALSDIGITRFNWTGIRITAVFLLPLLIFFPLFALLTNSPLTIRSNWHWFVLSAMLNNGLAEETIKCTPMSRQQNGEMISGKILHY